MSCPCDKLDTDVAYHCDLLDCRMTPHYCKLYRTRDSYRQAWDEGRGPGQVTTPPVAKRQKLLGAGTELTTILRSLGIAKEGCSGCSGMAGKMDRRGPQWCRDNIDEILDHMAKQATKRKLPFVAWGAKRMVTLAIHRAERKLKA